MSHQIGVVGLGVMGASLALNIEGHGFGVVGYDRDVARARALAHRTGGAVLAAESPAALAAALSPPRQILMMVPAGPPVDEAIAHLEPHLDAGDILMDGGNSWFLDTQRRARTLEAKGVWFLGVGISGGEEGARRGPSIMPGGHGEAWAAVAAVLEAIAARASDGQPCVAYLGPGGAGHYVKMVHNGIEYGDMQLLAETYDLLRRGAGLSSADLSSLFAEWNQGELQSYLVEITAAILARRDEETGQALVEMILDEAQQKGTGKWMTQNALDIGAPTPTINAAVESRIVSALKTERTAASRILPGPNAEFEDGRDRLVAAAREALYASKVTAYAQGMAQLRLASAEYGFALRPAVVARLWRAGCIIRARLLDDISAAFDRQPDLVNLLLDPAIRDAVASRQHSWRRMVQAAVGLGIPVPATCASLAYYDAYRADRLPANLTQAQRDYFGAHTYRRVDRDGVFHTEWT